MKLRTFAYWMAVLSLTACFKFGPDVPEDPLPLPPEIEANKDYDVKPGDSFFDYCNGTWLKATPYPATGAVGGPKKADEPMARRVEELKSTIPDIGRFFVLLDQLHRQPEETQAYLDTLRAGNPKPETREEAFAAIGQMLLDGADPGITFSISWVDGKWVGNLIPPFSLPDVSTEVTAEEMVPLTATKAEDSAAIQIIRGMGLDPDQFTTTERWEEYWNQLDALSLEGLRQLIAEAWDVYEIYISPEILEEKRSWMTEDELRSDARLTLNYSLSYHFAQKYLSDAFREKYLRITQRIQESLRNRILHVDWMSDATKNSAVAKLDNCILSVVCPDQWYPDCVAPLADCQTLVEAVHRNTAGKNRLFTKLIGTSDRFSHTLLLDVENSDGDMEPTDLTLTNAMYDENENTVYIYPGLLLPPMIPDNVSPAFAYAYFAIIGHELTHGFDAKGSQYDKDGHQRNWWTVADKMAFEQRQQNLIDCHGHMEMDPEHHPDCYGDGRRTLSENIADLGGFLAALDAYDDYLKAKRYFGKLYYDQLRAFYESFANLWCVQYSRDKFWTLYETDVHSHARLRVNGVVMNTDLWYELYDVDRNNYLYLPPERRTYIW